MFWSKNKKIMYAPVNPFFCIKVGCKGVFISRTCLHDERKINHKLNIFMNDHDMYMHINESSLNYNIGHFSKKGRQDNRAL